MYGLVDMYTTGNGHELVPSLPGVSGDAGKRVVFEQEILGVAIGDILDLDAVFQVTNDTGFNVRCSSEVRLCAVGGQGNFVGEQALDWNGENVTPGMHHMKIEKNGPYKATKAYARCFVKVIASSDRMSGSAFLTVERSRGRLTVKHHTMLAG